MALIEWDAKYYGLSISEIDIQHKQLIRILNRLHDAMKNGVGKEVVGEIINELINYTEYHFCTEESLFCKAEYAQAEEHKKAHCQFKDKLKDFKQKFDRGETRLALEIFRFLCDWIDSHIRKTDKQYAPIILDLKTGLRLRETMKS